MDATNTSEYLKQNCIEEITSNLLPPTLRVWKISFHDAEVCLKNTPSILSEDETVRLNQYLCMKEKERFYISRTVLRILLGHHLKISPKSLTFVYSQHCKPALSFPHHNTHFNVSHSGDCIVIAISATRVGIDVEHISQPVSTSTIGKRYFSDRENKYLNSRSLELQRREFFKIWVIKEACAKAVGFGVSGIEEIEVTVNDPTPGLVFKTEKQTDDWATYLFEPMPGYVGSVVCEKHEVLSAGDACRRDICN